LRHLVGLWRLGAADRVAAQPLAAEPKIDQRAKTHKELKIAKNIT
jgi:hypothetical protein